MPRYLVERASPAPLSFTPALMLERNLDHAVTWLHSYVTADGRRSFCVYEAAGPESIRRAALDSGLPVDSISLVRVLDPHAYRTEEAPTRR